MPHGDVQRVALVQSERIDVEVVLIETDACPLMVAVLVNQTAIQRVGMHIARRQDGLFDDDTQPHKNDNNNIKDSKSEADINTKINNVENISFLNPNERLTR